ncbi:hypothetical protein [Sulfurospirillum diekertiae]|uniref:hypothetical protein n=1 Tax=Sulfurospirillum diekertiae TaxID=1854492 RepID=UPI000B4D9CF5|nr:hypothetical protein [Sulfurospirillum diekertiae]ASC94217.1 hypothetical protein Sdiek2_2209 [Sulfurospirillum diekertiae]
MHLDIFLIFLKISAKKAAIYTAYTALLVEILNSVKDYAMAHSDFSSFMTPTICYFFTQLNVSGLLTTYFAVVSANWLKAKVVQFWTFNSGSVSK